MSLSKRIGSILTYSAALAFLSVFAHEGFHLIALKLLGGDGYITLSWQLAYTHFVEPPSVEWPVKLAGGLGVALLLMGFFWFWAWRSKTKFDTNLEVAAFSIGLGHLLYAPTELFGSYGVLAFGVGFLVGLLIYFRAISNWMEPGS